MLPLPKMKSVSEAPPTQTEQLIATLSPEVGGLMALMGPDVGVEVQRRLVNTGLSLPEFLTSQLGMASIPSSVIMPTLTALGFTADMIYGMVKQVPELAKRWQEMSTPEQAGALTDLATQIGMAAGFGIGAKRGLQAKLPERVPPKLPDTLSVEEAAANRTAVNLAAPGTLRPSEAQLYGPPAPSEPPPGMVTGEFPEPFKFARTPLQEPFMLPPREMPEPTPPPPIEQAETRGKVSFGAEAPTLAPEPLPARTIGALEAERVADQEIISAAPIFPQAAEEAAKTGEQAPAPEPPEPPKPPAAPAAQPERPANARIEDQIKATGGIPAVERITPQPQAEGEAQARAAQRGGEGGQERPAQPALLLGDASRLKGEADLTPLLEVGDENWIGASHGDARNAALMEANTAAQVDAILKAFEDDSKHKFLTQSGDKLSRAEAGPVFDEATGKPKGTTKKLESETLRDAKLLEGIGPARRYVKPAAIPPEASPATAEVPPAPEAAQRPAPGIGASVPEAPAKPAPEVVPTVREQAERIADILEAQKAPTGRGTMNLFGVNNVLWNAGLDAAKVVVRAGGTIADAIEAAIDHIKTHFHGAFDEARARAALGFSLRTGTSTPIAVPRTTSPATLGATSTLGKIRNTIATKAKTGQVRDVMAYSRDAGDNAALSYAEQMGNDVRGELRRAMNRTAKSTPLDEEALTFVREADGDRAQLAAMRHKLATSNKADPKWKKAALAAIDHGLANWDAINRVAEQEFRPRLDAEVDAENANEIETQRLKGYVPHVQDMPNEFGYYEGSGGAGGGAGFKHIRTFPTFADSIAAGVDPKSINAIELMKNRIAAGQRLINTRAWLDSLRTINDPKTGNPLLTDSVVTPRKNGPPDIKPPAGYVSETVGGRPIAVLSGYGGIFSALTDPSAFSSNAGFRMLRQTGAIGKSVSLMMDTFHLGRMAFWESIIKPLSLTDPKLPLPSFKRGVLTLDYTPKELTEMARTGEIDAAQLPGLLDARTKVKRLIDAGYNVGAVSDAMYQDLLHRVPIVKDTVGRFNKWLFNQFQRGAMAEVGVLELGRYQRMYPNLTEAQVARKVAHDLNIRFGNIGRQGWFKSRSAQDLARVIALAPQWNEGLIKSEWGALRGAGEALYGSVKERRLQAGVLPRAVGAMMLGQFSANQIINMVTRGKPTWENEEEGYGAKLSAWIPDFVDPSGPGFFLHPAGLAAEITHLLTSKYEKTEDINKSITSFLGSRASTLTRWMIPYFTRKDPFGRPIRPEEVTKESLKAAVPLPIPTAATAGVAKQVLTGEPGEAFHGQFQRQLMASAGIRTDQAPSPENRIQKLAGDFNREKKIKKSAEFYPGDYADLSRALSIGNMSDAKKLFKDLRAKKTVAQMVEHYKRLPAAPFTGQRIREGEFYAKLNPEQQETYQRAVAARREVQNRFFTLLSQSPP